MSELKDCPFCGAKSAMTRYMKPYNDGLVYIAACGEIFKCGLSISHQNEDVLVTVWNNIPAAAIGEKE